MRLINRITLDVCNLLENKCVFPLNPILSISRFPKIKRVGFYSPCLIKRMMHVLLKPNNDEVKALYQNHKSFYEGDCGLDLFCVEDQTVEAHDTSIINLGIRVSAFKKLEDGRPAKSVGWLMFPRSSMAKTPLRLSNSVGVIDPQFRGELRLSLDNIKDFPYTVKKGDRLVQMVSYDGEPITFEVVDELDETQRGSKGFGSTGR
uniref:Deoxyuridine 5'-triphosphate nucleotidohydrolase n=1 Tax=Theileria annulata TaxID=5874 RepID=A0A3B0N3V2_THEAN